MYSIPYFLGLVVGFSKMWCKNDYTQSHEGLCVVEGWWNLFQLLPPLWIFLLCLGHVSWLHSRMAILMHRFFTQCVPTFFRFVVCVLYPSDVVASFWIADYLLPLKHRGFCEHCADAHKCRWLFISFHSYAMLLGNPRIRSWSSYVDLAFCRTFISNVSCYLQLFSHEFLIN